MLMWLAAFFLVSGSIITLIAAVGVLRLPDFFMRMHAATKAGVFGSGLILLGVGFFEPSWGTWIKIGLAIFFLLLTTPMAGHLLGKAGFIGGANLWRGTTHNALQEVLAPGEFVERHMSEPGRDEDAAIIARAQAPSRAR
ncbi:monovalent cation/H(+) antiporter subunit G [Orrella sp. JC864]|uniref:monovalent cation/H(+) antiporter subunit G n=1 Tax=Orrella sp. JC864 TaxID=3120298 RepID=UPI0012BC6667